MINQIKNRILLKSALGFIGALSILALTACSSGGGGSAGPTVTAGDVSVVEGNSGTVDLVFTLTTSAAAGANATVTYTTSDGTAVAGQDYVAASGSVSVPEGSTTATVTITVNTDTDYEADETLTLTLSSPSGLTLGTDTTGTGTITNDDNADPEGYFTGTATVDTSTTLSDLIALAYDQRVLLFSRSGASNVLYDIQLGTVTGTDYAGTGHVYVNGANPQSITVTGTTNNAQITGIMTGGSGLATGSFDVLFDTANNRGATLARIESLTSPRWDGSLFGYDLDTTSFVSSDVGNYSAGDDSTERCQYLGSLVLPNTDINVYQLSHDIDVSIGVGNCSPPYESTGHTGFAAVIDTSTTDDTLVYAFTNGAIALFAVLTH